ncbi:hypothetical protein SLOPH_947 [Spraguea lophii 42_110]|uniref:Uncharacterized protein n=1 Tax=Spraguea lophii (strain 42_110) TaxID=1358809 RepID=S7W816_SPRLO|nr:hypothetical protein SLOPH_947 [Spraguea lophii 42_110]
MVIIYMVYILSFVYLCYVTPAYVFRWRCRTNRFSHDKDNLLALNDEDCILYSRGNEKIKDMDKLISETKENMMESINNTIGKIDELVEIFYEIMQNKDIFINDDNEDYQEDLDENQDKKYSDKSSNECKNSKSNSISNDSKDHKSDSISHKKINTIYKDGKEVVIDYDKYITTMIVEYICYITEYLENNIKKYKSIVIPGLYSIDIITDKDYFHVEKLKDRYDKLLKEDTYKLDKICNKDISQIKYEIQCKTLNRLSKYPNELLRYEELCDYVIDVIEGIYNNRVDDIDTLNGIEELEDFEDVEYPYSLHDEENKSDICTNIDDLGDTENINYDNNTSGIINYGGYKIKRKTGIQDAISKLKESIYDNSLGQINENDDEEEDAEEIIKDNNGIYFTPHRNMEGNDVKREPEAIFYIGD